MRAPLGLLLSLACLATAPCSRLASAAPPPSADLRLEWKDGDATITGPAGLAVSVPYRLGNLGNRAAFAVVLRTTTTLGQLHPAIRLQPGPRPGESSARSVELTLAAGMRVLCVDAQLQSLAVDEPPDPNPDNNRICRPIRVDPDPTPRPDQAKRTPAALAEAGASADAAVREPDEPDGLLAMTRPY